MTNNEKIRESARWLVEVFFMGEWSVVCYAIDYKDAEIAYKHCICNSSRNHRLVPKY